jgi:hypothetical protein
MILSFYFSAFIVVKTMVGSTSTGSKGSKRRGTHTDAMMAGIVFASAQDPLTLAEVSPGTGASELDIMLSGCSGVVDHGNVCSLLTECLRDVSFAALVLHMSLLIVLFLTLICFSIGYFFNKGY